MDYKSNLKSGLYIVSTPIGNLEDITLRAITILQVSDFIICEDTRVTRKLLEKHNINSKLIVYNDKSNQKDRDKISQLGSSKILSLVSDAGTPLISDPGYKLVSHFIKNNLYVDIAPGPCAAISALTLSGMPSDNFFFGGFLPRGQISISNYLKKHTNNNNDYTMIFYESASRLIKSLYAALDSIGDRECAIIREMTKIFQECKRGKISDVIKYYEDKPPKGEIVIIFSGIQEKTLNPNIDKEIIKLLSTGLSAKDITELISRNHNHLSKKEIYNCVNLCKKSLKK